MNILISGSTGLIGTALKNTLNSAGHSVYPLHRNMAGGVPFYWSPTKNSIHLDETIQLDIVVHLAGENIADSRWTKEKKREIIQSREDGTRILCHALANLSHKPALLISGSAIGFYGETGSDIVDENSHAGTGFLAEIAQRWEAATQAAEQAGIKTVHIRTGLVLSPLGGVLQRMLLPVKMGLGGKVGNGQQYMSWVSISDMINMIQFIIENNSLQGPVNMVSKNPVTNSTFIKTLGKVLNRPTFFPLPAFMARLLFGEMADPLLLSSTRVYPAKLEAAGYEFINDDLESALKDLLVE